MKRSPKLQWTGFALVITLLASVIVLTASATWKHLSELRRDLSTFRTESFHLADHLEALIFDMNANILRFDSHKEPKEAKSFASKTAHAGKWIIEQKMRVKTSRERALLDQITRALETYVSETASLLKAEPANLLSTPLVDRLERAAAPYLSLCRQFDEAQQWVLGEFGQQSERTTMLLQRLLVFAALLLLSFWAVVAAVLYRVTVAPLRAKLIETRGLVERQEKLASLGTLAAGVAHEIRNPLTAIKVRLHSLKKMLAEGSSEQEDALMIATEIQRLERIVKDFLQFARPSDPEFVATTADAVLNHVRELFRDQFDTNRVEMKLVDSPPLRIRVDPQQIQQVLMNLIQNAADSIQQNGSVTLRAFATRCQFAGRSSAAVALEVTDTGKGIPPEVQKRLFDPFFTTKAAGTGLGLSIAARIVESHGGALQYQTELNHGTTFRVILPAAHTDEE